MLKTERMPLPVDVANELRDALRRRQKELPSRWLAALDAAALRKGTAALARHDYEDVERELGLATLQNTIPDARPRGVVCIRPSASPTNLTLANALCMRGSVASIAAAELDAKLAIEMLERIASRDICESSSAVACDCTIELPLPDDFPRPRVYFCLGNLLGNVTAVGAVRLLRILRTTMGPSDSLLLGVETASPDAGRDVSDDEFDAAASRHLGALELLNTTVGAGFDLSGLDYRTTFDAENNRVETHLVARRACEVEIPGVCDIRLRRGESIRTSVNCTFERGRLSAMMAGVGLALRQWSADTSGRFAVALATPAV